MKQNKKSEVNPLLFYGAILILFLYTFRNVNQGIDVTDTGYHFSNFIYVNEMDPMWIFSTYIASILGHFFTLLPYGDTLLGMNIYTSMIPALLGVITFCFFVKVMKVSLLEAFGGVQVSLALCWCPATCVYNYLTYFFFCAGAMLLYMGLTQNKERILVFAGVCLGLNVLVRFPNIAEAALILAVWYTSFIRKEKIGEYLKKTGWCLLGYLLGIGIVFIQIGFEYGIGEYVNGVIRLLGMTSDASDYTLYAMVYNLIRAYIFSGKWVLIIVFCIGLGVLGYMVLPGRYVTLKNIGYAACCLVLVRWFLGQGMFSMVYDSYGAVLNWGSVTIIAALIFALWNIVSSKAAEAEKIYSAIVIIIIGITPLGSNNQMYANLNNMFLVVPFVMHVFVRYLYGAKTINITIKEKKIEISKNPLIIMMAVCLAMLVSQSMNFGTKFIFRDSIPRHSEVSTIQAVAGMKTNEANAKALEELGAYVTEAELTGKAVLLFGDVPALSAYLKMPFVMSPWPDLPSYSNNTFETELAEVLDNIENNRPVIILGASFYDFLTNQLEDIEKHNLYEKKYGFKMNLIRDMIKEHNYTCTFENDAYVIFE